MADSFSKKERAKKKRKKAQDKKDRRERRKQEGKTQIEFMYVDENGNLTTEPQDPSKRSVKLEDVEIGVPKSEDTDESRFEKQGKVKFFNAEKGYGFILDVATDQSYFIHANDLEVEIDADDAVTFEVGSGPKGPIAIKVKKVAE
ncbi:cold-shock protein [Lewinella sp. W8]|uniref:cold-shock protein n=1 Tax=Lewinella sp. W8 TaxID=2528208 RepID=UPI0010688686|nr:cold shock domain-containing protein [Lewinella sp. W8]MTB52753.1 cold shock domain-containing protein [Lewinella sp. W8]